PLARGWERQADEAENPPSTAAPGGWTPELTGRGCLTTACASWRWPAPRWTSPASPRVACSALGRPKRRASVGLALGALAALRGVRQHGRGAGAGPTCERGRGPGGGGHTGSGASAGAGAL